jgi:acetyl-CoA C-acetyltransferase
MNRKVAIVGAGYTPLRAVSPYGSFRELIFEAAVRAYQEAGIRPAQIDSVVSVGEDYSDGTCIMDEYTPDQLGAVQKPVHTVAGDGLQGLGVACMLIQTGCFEVVVLEGHCKASNICYPAHIEAMALDPVYVRPHGWNPVFVAGLEMQRFLQDSGNTEAQAALVAVKNKRNALKNPLAAYPAEVSREQVLASRPLSLPVRELTAAPTADGAFVFVLVPETALDRYKGQPVFVDGIAWISDTCNVFTRDWGRALYAEKAAELAYEEAGIKDPASAFDFAEIDDTYAYKELQHLEALKLAPRGQSGRLLEQGAFDPGGKLPVNVSGGALGCGNLLEANPLRGLLEAVWQLRGQAGLRQLRDPRRGVVCSWRALPTATGAVAVLSRR